MTWQPVTATSPPRGKLVIIQTINGALMFAVRFDGGWTVEAMGVGKRHIPLHTARAWMDAPEKYVGE